MNAVNLIPRDSRSRREGVGVSPPTLAVIGGLVVALIAAVLYVTAANTVSTRKSELSQITAGVAGWTAAANSYSSFVALAKQRSQELADVRQLASSRFPWSSLLGQIGGLMPRSAALISLQAVSAAATSGTPVPTVQLTGCASTQSAVAQTLVQLREVKGVSGVTLSSSSDSGASSTSGSSSTGQSAGGCPFPVQFALSMAFTASSATPAATTAAATTTTATPATTTTTAAAAQ